MGIAKNGAEKRDEHAPHGGTWIAGDEELIEISVFETNVPPRFRLYFFDIRKRVRPVPKDKVTLETIRPDGARQLFTFIPHGDFLESTAEIPEPHEFDVNLHVSHDGHAHVFKTKFTEAHGHDHAGESYGGHAHGADDHGHKHGSGFSGWLRGTFGHSHSIVDKIDQKMETHERGIRALKISLVGLGLTAALQLIIVLISGSVGLMADMIHNFADAGTSIPLWIAFALARHGASRRYTYGYGKTEDVAGVVIILIIFFSACVAAYESVMKIIHPQPVTNLGWVVAAAVLGFLGNEAVAVFRIKVGKEIGSAALIADGQHARVDGFTSLAVLIGVIGVWLGFPILDPLVGIGITIAILFIVKNAAISIWVRLIDGIDPEILEKIEHAPRHITDVRGVRDVRARWIGHKVYAELAIEIDPTLSISQGNEIAVAVEKTLREHIPLVGGVAVRLFPAAPAIRSC